MTGLEKAAAGSGRKESAFGQQPKPYQMPHQAPGANWWPRRPHKPGKVRIAQPYWSRLGAYGQQGENPWSVAWRLRPFVRGGVNTLSPGLCQGWKTQLRGRLEDAVAWVVVEYRKFKRPFRAVCAVGRGGASVGLAWLGRHRGALRRVDGGGDRECARLRRAR